MAKYSRYGITTPKADLRRDLNPALLKIEGEIDALQVSSTTTVHLYLSAANGLDTRDGTTPAKAVKTWARLMELFPRIRKGAVILHLGAGDYDITAQPIPQSVAIGKYCPVYIKGDGAGQTGDDGHTVVASGTAESGSTDLFINSTIASANLYAGLTLEWTTGANVGFRRDIQNNTTSGFAPTWRLKTVPTVGDAWRITQPSVNLVFTDACMLASGLGGSNFEHPLVLINIGFNDTVSAVGVTPLRVCRIADCGVLAYGIKVYNGSVQLSRSLMQAGISHTWNANADRVMGNVPPVGTSTASSYLTNAMPDIGFPVDSFDWEGWGICGPFAANTLRQPLQFDYSAFRGCIVGDQIRIPAGSFAVFVGGGINYNSGSGSVGTLSVDGWLRIHGTTGDRLGLSTAQSGPGQPFTINTLSQGLIVAQGGSAYINELVINCTSTSATALIVRTANITFQMTEITSNGLVINVGGGVGLFLDAGAVCEFVSNATGKYTFTSGLTTGIGVQARGARLSNLTHFTFTNGSINLSAGTTWSNIGNALVGNCTSLTVAASIANINGSGGSSTLAIGSNTAGLNCWISGTSRVLFTGLVLTLQGRMLVEGFSNVQFGAAIGASTHTSSSSGAALWVETGCAADYTQITSGTMTITQSGAFRAPIRVKGELYYSNARMLCSGAAYGVDLSGGGRVFVDVQPTNTVGSTRDFIDESATTNAYNDTELAATDLAVFRGQHPSGTYNSALPPTGNSFVQRTA